MLWVHDGDPMDATATDGADDLNDLVLTDEQMDALAATVAPVGYRVVRGAYQGTSDDRADRWYVEREDATVVDRRGPGHATVGEALEDADRRSLEELAADLRATRDRLGLSQRAMAAALRVPLRTYESWEGGQEPQHPSVLRLAVAELERRAG